ncbi:Ger(x)C family spore germination protein [Bacillus sp. SRB3LM]|uniref:Ger(x)C family spore germination protein n=1 Tax=Bacillus sp. SRB3LM TaxID=2608689 RepID=UPI0018C35637|nr:Ger(x)C family spore germination protein [Bacillus sp. SRB3LM]MBG0968045.1 Ger(x)C family spore germination protein [Bacillus sp. SRB3LM]MBG0970365.1 Ger(x)C family spore germination protein [Bacillus sp. SRB3LM]MBG0971078.1 Ger(x)C family spore germination protein [Bacillus sp. SRB3LM]
MKSSLKLISIVFLFCLLCACAERREIEELGFVVGAAYDQAPGEGIKGTYQMVLPNTLSTSERGTSTQKNYINLSATGESIFAHFRMIAKKISRPLFFPHIQVIIFSDKLLQTPYMLQHILDVYTRDDAMRRNIRLFVSKGNAEHILKQNAGPEYLPAKYVEMLSEHTQKNAQMVEKKRIGDIHSKILAKKSFILPVLLQTKQGIALSGAALFSGKDNRFVTILPAKDTASLNYMTGSQIRGIFTVLKQKQLITFEFQRVHHRMKIDVTNQTHPKVDIYVMVDGKLAEIHSSLQHQFSLQQLNNLLSKEMEKQLQSTIQRIQKQYKLDVLEIGDAYQRKDYKKWKTIEKNWENGKHYFTTCQIRIHVKPNMTQSGSTLPK